MRIFHGIKRHSHIFGLLLFLFASASLFAFLVSSSRNVTVAECEKLGIPVLEISTDKLKEIKTKEKYVKASFSLGNSEEQTKISGKCKVRGHGNSTWKTTFTQKNPYLLKLENPAGLLGMKSARKWILIANACDRSMLRNYYAEYLTHNVWNKMRWNPVSRYVTLFINGKYRGLYSITEKVEVEKNRIEFAGEGFLAEIDSHSGRPYSFSTGSRLRFNIRSPKSTPENYRKWAEQICSLEKLLYSDKWNGAVGYKKFFDMDSFVDWYLLAEFSKNYDANFYNSVFMNFDYSAGKLFMGPAWDHDIAFGNTAKGSTSPGSYGSLLSNNAWLQMFNLFDPAKNSSDASDCEGFLINQSHWYNRMFSDDEFVSLVKRRWAETREPLKKSLEWLRIQGRDLNEAAELNDSVWHIIGSANWPRAPRYRSRKTYKSEVDFLVDWCEKRFEWLDMIFSE